MKAAFRKKPSPRAKEVLRVWLALTVNVDDASVSLDTAGVERVQRMLRIAKKPGKSSFDRKGVKKPAGVAVVDEYIEAECMICGHTS